MQNITLSRRAELEQEFGVLIAARYDAQRAHAGAPTEQTAADLELARRSLAQWCRKHQREVERLHHAGIDEAERINYRIAHMRQLRDSWQFEGKTQLAEMADRRLRDLVVAARREMGLEIVQP